MSNLTTAQAATKLKVDPATIRRWCKSGRLTAERFGRAWMIDETALDGFEAPKRGRPIKAHDPLREIPLHEALKELENAE